MHDSYQSEPSREHIFVTVVGGVAYVAEATTVNVHIIDYDDLKADFEGAFGRLSPEERAFYDRNEKASGPSGLERR